MRIGLIAKKIGMSRIFKSDGVNTPVTLLKIDHCTIVEKKTADKHGYNAVSVSYGLKKKHKVNKARKGFYKKNQIDPPQIIKEFRISENAFIDKGTKIDANHFIPGQKVDITGFTIGKGFAGGMKRHNFAGNRATHGVSISHRSHGSTGQCQDPGKVFKGKKMAGRLGNVKRTIQNLEIIDTRETEQLIIVKGSVPGPKGLYVTITDSKKHTNKDLPFPTFMRKQQSDKVIKENIDNSTQSESSVIKTNESVAKDTENQLKNTKAESNLSEKKNEA